MNPSSQPTISIALCTYNGAAYLPAQWASLLAQTKQPDEVVICDDQSTDGTVALLNQLAAESPFSVRILVNAERLGYNKNFERVLSACTGDLIFICDQDDAWFPEKIDTMTRYMADHPATEAAFCDAWVTDEQLQHRQSRFWEWVRFNAEARSRVAVGRDDGRYAGWQPGYGLRYRASAVIPGQRPAPARCRAGLHLRRLARTGRSRPAVGGFHRRTPSTLPHAPPTAGWRARKRRSERAHSAAGSVWSAAG